MRTVKKWTPEEDQYLIANNDILTRKQIAKHLDRSLKSVAYRKKNLGLTDAIAQPWTELEEEYVKQNFGVIEVKEMAKKLNRTEAGIYHKIGRLGLNADTRFGKAWTEEELIILEEYWGKVNLSHLCKKLGRTRTGVLDQAVRVQRLGPSKNAQGYYTAGQMADIAGVSKWMMLRWIKDKNLPAVKKSTRGAKMYQIDLGKFIEWARTQYLPSLKGVLDRVG